MQSKQRGFSLLTALVVVVVLTVLVAAAIEFTGEEVVSSRQHQQRAAVASCAVAARSWVVSQLQCGRANAAANLEFITQGPGWDAGSFIIRPGHLDDPDPLTPADLQARAEEVQCPRDQQSSTMIDLTNTTAGPGGGGGLKQCYRVVAHCIEAKTGIRNEVEFMVKLL